MLVKRQEKDEKIKSIYASSNICASIYDKQNKDFTLIFNNGGQYKYANVNETDYVRFEVADSQGIVFNSHIKKYPFVKLDNVDTKVILSEISEIKSKEEKGKLDLINQQMMVNIEKLRSAYVTSGLIETTLLNKVKLSIAEYDTAITSKLDKVNG